jgi:hypothetical protein
MQRFGLDALQQPATSVLETEILKEKASALGRAGAALQGAVAVYRDEADRGWPSDNRECVTRQISESLNALMIQRELSGLTHENVKWMLDSYGIPEEAIRHIGL